MLGRRMMPVRLAWLGLTLLVSAFPARAAEDARVLVFAAASLKNALDAAVDDWSATGGRASISYAGSSTLAKQIERGAPADLFISANQSWMDYLQERGLIVPETRSDLLRNRLVMIAPKDSDVAVTLARGVDIAAVLGSGKLAMANTDSVPAGIYGKAALTWLGAWDKVARSIAQAQDVRAALALVSRGEAPLGIVYATDAAADPNVKVVATFPEESHEPVVYPAALVKDSDSPAASSLLDFLKSPDAARHFEEQGFAFLP